MFTALALGCGFPGGEVTPLFVIGTTLGGALAGPLGLDVHVLGAIGFVAVFAGAANKPLACTIMGTELLGFGSVVAMAVACVVAYACSSYRGIYAIQRIATAKGPTVIGGHPTVTEWHRRHTAGSRSPETDPGATT